MRKYDRIVLRRVGVPTVYYNHPEHGGWSPFVLASEYVPVSPKGPNEEEAALLALELIANAAYPNDEFEACSVSVIVEPIPYEDLCSIRVTGTAQLRARALAKLTDNEKMLLGLPNK